MRRLPKRSTRRVTSRVLGRHPHRSGPDSGAVTRHGFQIGDGGRATMLFRRFCSRGGSRPRSRPSASPRYRDVNCPVPAHRESSIKIVAIALVTCPILSLSLGPLDLNLLGLVIHLDEVSTSPSTRGRAGNLLGNLLCAVAGLLDAPSTSAPERHHRRPAQLILGNLKLIQATDADVGPVATKAPAPTPVSCAPRVTRAHHRAARHRM